MAVYNITLSDGVTIVSIPDGSVDLTLADIPLVGQNTQLYGDDIARAQLFMLENFANSAAPSINPIKGQLWFDTTAGSETLKVRNTSGAWVPMAPFTLGTVDSAMPRWNDATKSWIEETQLQLSAAGVLTILDAGLSASVAFSHNATDLNIVGTATTDINITGVTAVNMPSITLTTALAETDGGTGTDTYATGDVLFASSANTLSKLVAATDGDVLTLASGVPSWVAGAAGVSEFNDLSDVNLAGAADDDILFRSGGNWIDSAGAATWDGSNFSATNIGGITESDLIDRSAPGTISGSPTLTADIVMQSDITLRDNDSIVFGTGGDVAMSFDTADLTIAATTSVDLNLTGFTGAFKSNVAGHFGIAGGTGAGVRVIGDGNSDSLNEGFFSVYHNDQGQEQVRMGTSAGNSFSEVRALTNDLNLYASGNLIFNLNTTETTVTQGVDCMKWHAVSGNNISTTASVNDSGGTQRNVGYNETPESIVSSARTIDVDDIGKFLRRSASTSRVITLDNDSDIPVGGSLMVHNDHTSNTLTIEEGTITDLEWVDGSGSAPLTGTRTIAYNGVVTLRKKSSTRWQIWGNGIS